MILKARNLRHRDAAHGLTLVELLVTIMLMGIISSTVLCTMTVAQESARKAHTRAVIATLHSLLIEKWESYLTRRQNFNVNGQYVSAGPRAAAALRLKTIRQMLKMDFPDQWSDVEYITLNTDSVDTTVQTYLYSSYKTIRSNAVTAYLPTLGLTAAEQTERLEQNEGAECLYSIMEFSRGTADRYKLMESAFIGDTDNDSLLEILDDWGRPIIFIRWPTGFASDMQCGKPGTVALTGSETDAGWLDHDPFDPYRVEPHAYRTVPLIISGGPDGLLDVAICKLNYSAPSVVDMSNRWNPYYAKDGRRPGEACDENGNSTEDWHDNIHNHLINTK